MAHKKGSDDPKIAQLLAKLDSDPARDPRAAAQGRARFLAQAQDLAPVSNPAKMRHIGWNKNIFERIWNPMKPLWKFSTLAAVVFIAVVAAFTLNNVTTVSAKQILERASAAQSAPKPAQGIQHYRIEIYKNPLALPGNQPGVTTITDDYTDMSTGNSRRVTVDAAGKVVEVSANDAAFNYWTYPVETAADGSLIIHRVPRDPVREKPIVPAATTEPSQSAPAANGARPAAGAASAIFDSFRSNPRVELQGKEIRPDGSQVYVLVDRNYQTQKSADGQASQIYTGSAKMVFNTQTYQLVATETSVRKDGQDIVIEAVDFLLDEVLPTGSPVAWDLSDLKGVTIAGAATPQAAQTEAIPVPITLQELATHASTYVLRGIPAGYTQEIIAAPHQPKDQPYAYEVNYNGPDQANFGLQAVGIMDPGFVELNFYDGSYKTASGLVLHFSTSSGKNSTSAMLVTPEGTAFLLFSTFSREQTETWAENIVPAK